MNGLDAAQRFAAAPVAVLATASIPGPTANAVPHVVPVVFAVHFGGAGETIYTAVDAKRKTTQRLRRLSNIAANPTVSLLVEHYDADWTQLWWARADGVASVHHGGEEMAAGYSALRRKYPQYDRVALDGPVVSIAVSHWSSWLA